MSIVDTAAKTNSLKNDYGTSKGSNSPATVYLAFFADSAYATELTGTGGIPRIPISNVDAQFTTSAAVTSNVNALTSSASTGAWGSSATYAALMSTSSGAGDKWDGGALSSSVTISASGTTITVAAGALQITQP